VSVTSPDLLAEPDEAETAMYPCESGRQFAVLAPKSRMAGDCELFASVLYRRMCPHEHARDAYVCGVCAAKLNARGTCLECLLLEGDLAHRCRIALLPLNREVAA